MPTPGQLTNRPTSGIDKLQQVPKNSSAQIFETIGFPRPRRDLCVRDLPFEKPPGGSVRLLVQFRPNGCVRGPHCLGAGALFQLPINLNLCVQHDLDDRQQHIHTLRQYVCLHQVPGALSDKCSAITGKNRWAGARRRNTASSYMPSPTTHFSPLLRNSCRRRRLSKHSSNQLKKWSVWLHRVASTQNIFLCPLS